MSSYASSDQKQAALGPDITIKQNVGMNSYLLCSKFTHKDAETESDIIYGIDHSF